MTPTKTARERLQEFQKEFGWIVSVKDMALLMTFLESEIQFAVEEERARIREILKI